MEREASEALDRLERERQAVISYPFGEDEVADVIGRVRKVERDLADFRRGFYPEMPHDGYQGTTYRIVPVNERARSYNTARLLFDLGSQGETVVSTLLRLIAEDVVRLEWQWLKLRSAAKAAGVDLVVEFGELADPDLDAPHVGWWWESGSPRIEGIEA